MLEILNNCLPVVFTGISTYLVWRFQNKHKGNKAMMILMRRELRELHEKHMAAGSISSEELGEFQEIYEVYHELGGNGTGTVWKKDVEGLNRI